MAIKSLFQNISKKTWVGAAAALTLLSAQASPVSLSYNGQGLPGSWAHGAQASGTGSFTTVSGNYFGNLALSDLASFDGDTQTFHYGLAELKKFSASIDAQGFQSLTLQTTFQPGGPNWAQALGVDGLGPNLAYSYNFDIPGDLSTGQITARLEPAATVPEPAALALTLGALGLAAWAGRQQRGQKSA